MTRAAGKASAVRVHRPPQVGTGARAAAGDMTVRPAQRADLDAVIAIDRTVTGIEKRDYWRSVFRRYANNGQSGRQFLVADAGGQVAGFVIGEVRDWEFGSPPCGWVFGIDVRPDMRLSGVGTRLLAAICERFGDYGVQTVRTMLARDNTLVLSFFRSQGMMAGPFIPLEMDLGQTHEPTARAMRSARSR
ncbi:MAG TPA: GNAT family N-acetyltransferase [Casimicrobiaceae bacterium]|nr:GNAT family N-acetyltransferase [Casimicrobiaceae bacterium]